MSSAISESPAVASGPAEGHLTMARARSNCALCVSGNPAVAVLRRFRPDGFASFLRAAFVIACLIACLTQVAFGSANPHLPAAEQAARAAYAQARQAWTNDLKSPVLAWQFGRACFDLAEYVTPRRERARLAEEGIEVCQMSLRLGTNSAAAHYYLAMNLGQLARTKGFSALRLVSQLRREFEAACALDETFDNAGPHRNLGYLFRDTPTWTGIGDRKKAELHLTKAVKIAPDHPENWLALIEGRLDWGARDKARKELEQLETLWPLARKRLTGPFWKVSWYDWEQRLEKIRKKLGSD